MAIRDFEDTNLRIGSLTGRASRVRLSHFVGEAIWPLRGRGEWLVIGWLRKAMDRTGGCADYPAPLTRHVLLPPPATSYHYHYAINNYH